MELSFALTIIALLTVWWFRNPIKQKSADVERDMKVASAEDGVDTARRVIAVKREVDSLGDIPNIDDVLNQLNGKAHKRTETTLEGQN